MMLLCMVTFFLSLTPSSFVKQLQKKKIDDNPPPPKYTSKEVDRSPQFKNCSAGPVTNIELHR